MTINRKNYEEWFLLYVDSELTLHQRMEVEMFVQQHPDLAAELEALQQATLPGDHSTMGDLSFLKAHTGPGIDITNYEEQFLLYVDKELDAAAGEQVEQFAAKYPVYGKKLEQLQMAVLQPEAIACPGKQSLYKKDRRVIPFYLPRIAAAAALLGVLALGWWWKTGNTHTGAGLAGTSKPATAAPATTAPAVPQTQAGTAQEELTATAQQPTATATPAHTATAKELPADKTQKLASVHSPAVTNTNAVNRTTTAPDATPAAYQPVTTEAQIAGTQAAVSSQPLGTGALPALPEKTIPVNTAATAPQVAYQEINTTDDDRGIYIGSLDINKNKLKGFLKKAGRLFSAKAKTVADDDGQLQLANMKINTRQ